jgi:hypothetical protein
MPGSLEVPGGFYRFDLGDSSGNGAVGGVRARVEGALECPRTFTSQCATDAGWACHACLGGIHL